MRVFSTEFTVECGDCDEAGIVFYPNYFYWLDCTYQRFLRSRSLGQRQIRDRFSAVTPLVDVGLRFRSPLRYDDVLRIEARLSDWEERRFRIDYTLTSDDRKIAEGHEFRAWAILADTGLKGAPVAPEFRRLME